MTKYLMLVLSAVLVNNFVLSRFLGICPFLGVSKQISTALGMSGAVIFVMTIASAVTWTLQHMILEPLGVGYLQTLLFILVIAAFVQFVELVLKKSAPALHKALGIYLPLITTNCAVLGVAVLNIKMNLDFFGSVLFGFGGAVGFGLALVIFAGIREKLDRANPPRPFQGTALALVTAGLLSLSFMGFANLVK
ncbi:MAG: electron transport complex subunit RsxA [Kiritimatiellia bacterium]